VPSGIFDGHSYVQVNLEFNKILSISEDLRRRDCNVQHVLLKDNFVDEETIEKFKNWMKFNGYRGGSENFFKCHFKNIFVSFGIIFLFKLNIALLLLHHSIIPSDVLI
jgi:hypothetical protein